MNNEWPSGTRPQSQWCPLFFILAFPVACPPRCHRGRWVAFSSQCTPMDGRHFSGYLGYVGWIRRQGPSAALQGLLASCSQGPSFTLWPTIQAPLRASPSAQALQVRSLLAISGPTSGGGALADRQLGEIWEIPWVIRRYPETLDRNQKKIQSQKERSTTQHHQLCAHPQ